MVPEKFKRYPFVTWGCVLVTIGFFVWLFGPDNVWTLINKLLGVE
jgi:hypothetical protein